MLGFDLTARLRQNHQVIPLTRAEADITDAAATAETIRKASPDAVIHAAAFTAVDRCENERDLAFRVNGEGTRNVVQVCRQLSIPLAYVSTDYVFDGGKSAPYVETDAPHPLNVYGASKLEGEQHVQTMPKQNWIVRTSWLFGPAGKNFVEAILAQARDAKTLRVVRDQIGSPTYTEDLAAALERVIEQGKPGIYHVSNQGACSWFEFARQILQQAGFDPSRVVPAASSDFARPARRPQNSQLANTRLVAEGLPLLPPWQDALRRYLGRTRAAKF